MRENNLFDIKRRVAAAEQTRKITRTMELIASTRLQRGKVLLSDAQNWLIQMTKATRCLPDAWFMPISDNLDNQNAYIVFCGSKGLSGSYGSNLLQYAKPVVQSRPVIAVGGAAENYFPNAHIFLGDNSPSLSYAGTIAQTARTLYKSGKTGEIHMIYPQDFGHLTKQLFPPVRQMDYDDTLIVDPSSDELYKKLSAEYTQATVYEAHIQAYVAEQVARVSAMDNATQNADEIIENLQATYNRLRQSSITEGIITVGNTKKGAGVRHDK